MVFRDEQARTNVIVAGCVASIQEARTIHSSGYLGDAFRNRVGFDWWGTVIECVQRGWLPETSQWG